jgi:hypothetical protein
VQSPQADHKLQSLPLVRTSPHLSGLLSSRLPNQASLGLILLVPRHTVPVLLHRHPSPHSIRRGRSSLGKCLRQTVSPSSAISADSTDATGTKPRNERKRTRKVRYRPCSDRRHQSPAERSLRLGDRGWATACDPHVAQVSDTRASEWRMWPTPAYLFKEGIGSPLFFGLRSGPRLPAHCPTRRLSQELVPRIGVDARPKHPILEVGTAKW